MDFEDVKRFHSLLSNKRDPNTSSWTWIEKVVFKRVYLRGNWIDRDEREAYAIGRWSEELDLFVLLRWLEDFKMKGKIEEARIIEDIIRHIIDGISRGDIKVEVNFDCWHYPWRFETLYIDFLPFSEPICKRELENLRNELAEKKRLYDFLKRRIEEIQRGLYKRKLVDIEEILNKISDDALKKQLIQISNKKRIKQVLIKKHILNKLNSNIPNSEKQKLYKKLIRTFIKAPNNPDFSPKIYKYEKKIKQLDEDIFILQQSIQKISSALETI